MSGASSIKNAPWQARPVVPVYVADSANVYGGGAAEIAAAYLPFVVGADPNHPQFKVNNLSLTADLRDRLDDRVSLLKAIDQVKHGVIRRQILPILITSIQRRLIY